MIITPLHPQISFTIIKPAIWIWGSSCLPKALSSMIPSLTILGNKKVDFLSTLIQTRRINRINLVLLPKNMRNVWRAKVMRRFNSMALGIKELLSWKVDFQQSSHSVMKVRMLKCPKMRWLIPNKTTKKKKKATLHLWRKLPSNHASLFTF